MAEPSCMALLNAAKVDVLASARWKSEFGRCGQVVEVYFAGMC